MSSLNKLVLSSVYITASLNLEFAMNVLDIFSSQLGLTLWTTGVSAALILASGLCVYILPWQDRNLTQTHNALKDTLSPLQASSLSSQTDMHLVHSS